MDYALIIQADGSVILDAHHADADRLKPVLEDIARIDSAGEHAVMFRILPDTLGVSAHQPDELIALLREHSRTGIPAPLEVMITDVLNTGTKFLLYRDGNEFLLEVPADHPHLLQRLSGEIEHLDGRTYRVLPSKLASVSRTLSQRLVNRVGEQNYPKYSGARLEREELLPREFLGRLGVPVYDGELVVDNQDFRDALSTFERVVAELSHRFQNFLPDDYKDILAYRFAKDRRTLEKPKGYLGNQRTAMKYLFILADQSLDTVDAANEQYDAFYTREQHAYLLGKGFEVMDRGSFLVQFKVPASLIPEVKRHSFTADVYFKGDISEKVQHLISEIQVKFRRSKHLLPLGDPLETLEQLYGNHHPTKPAEPISDVYHVEHSLCLLDLVDRILPSQQPSAELFRILMTKTQETLYGSIYLAETEAIHVARQMGFPVFPIQEVEEKYHLPLRKLNLVPEDCSFKVGKQSFYLLTPALEQKISYYLKKKQRQFRKYQAWLPQFDVPLLLSVFEGTSDRFKSAGRPLQLLDHFDNNDFGREVHGPEEHTQLLTSINSLLRGNEQHALYQALGFEYVAIAQVQDTYSIPEDAIKKYFSGSCTSDGKHVRVDDAFIEALQNFESDVHQKVKLFGRFITHDGLLPIAHSRYDKSRCNKISWENIRINRSGIRHYFNLQSQLLNFLGLFDVNVQLFQDESLFDYVLRREGSVSQAVHRLKEVGVEFKPVEEIAIEMGIPSLGDLLKFFPGIERVETAEHLYLNTTDPNTWSCLNLLKDEKLYKRE